MMAAGDGVVRGRGRILRRMLACAILCAMAFMSTEAPGEENIRVLIADGLKRVVFQSKAGLIREKNGTRTVSRRIDLHASDAGAGLIRIRPNGAPVRLNNKLYRGTFEVRKKGSVLQVVNELDLEDYLKGVVAAEIPHEWHDEALKTQAVASRTYAFFQKQQAGRRLYHLQATVNSQVYLGIQGERPRAVNAVNETRGQILRYNGQPIAAYYHSSCGGHTEDARELWGIDAPYLCGVDCDCQLISKYGLWEKRFSLRTLLTLLRREGYGMRDIAAVEAGELTPAGRMKRVLFRSDRGTISVPSEVLRASLGYSNVPSIFFEPELLDGEFVLSGRGMGHGVGLCQWGVQELALRGREYRAILRHYYPGADIGTI